MSRKLLLLVAVAVAVLASAAPSFASGSPVCGVVNHNVCVSVTDTEPGSNPPATFDPIASGNAVGQDWVTITNDGRNTVNDVNLVLTGNTTFPGGGNSFAWRFKQLKAGQSQTVSTLFNSLAAPGTIHNCADADWNENTRNGGRQDGLPDDALPCEDTGVSTTAGLTVVPKADQGQALGLTNVQIGTNPAGQQTGKATIPLLSDFQGKATIFSNAPDPTGYACDNDKVRINGKQYACRGGPFFKLSILDANGNDKTYPVDNPIIEEFTEPSGSFDGTGLPLAVFHAGDTGGVNGLATALCTPSTLLDTTNGCFVEEPTVANGLTHFKVKFRHNARYH